MKKRSVVAVVLLPFVTFGIYALYWFVKTKGELNARGAQIPTAWLLIIPLVNIWWIWKYFEGAEQVTNGKVNGILMFIIDILVTAIISMAICQDAYNNLGESVVSAEENSAPQDLQTVSEPTPEAPVPPANPTPPTPPVVQG